MVVFRIRREGERRHVMNPTPLAGEYAAASRGRDGSRTMGFMIPLLALATATALLSTAPPAAPAEEDALPGEVQPPATLGPGVVETMAEVLARIREREEEEPDCVGEERGRAPGSWVVPSRRGTFAPHSGEHHVTNRWGDTRMGIGFPAPVRLRGAWIAGQASRGAWTDGLRVIGYRDGVEVARTEWFEEIGESPAWFAMELEDVDRIELVARPVLEGAGWYALDDLTFERPSTEGGAEGQHVVVGFDDLEWRTRLTGTDYAGLSWEEGAGEYRDEPEAIHAPIVPPGHEEPVGDRSSSSSTVSSGTLPTLVRDFAGMGMFENGTSYIPPDTCGVAGPSHFVSVVNVKLGVFDQATGSRVFALPLADFFNVATGLGDPRVTYDHHSQRYFLLCSSGPSTARIHLAISLTGDPTGAWFKSWIDTAQGSDAGRWPDYPTLGFDENGFYTSALMVPSTVTIWAIDKAPLLTGTPSLGTVTAWRDLPFEGATQPCATYGDSGGELFVSRLSTARHLRIRQISGPLTAPTLSIVANVTVPLHGNPPAAPALGSQTDLSTGDTRPMNAVYRDGSIFTAHTIKVDGRAACRWYEVDVASGTTLQVGTISDPLHSYYYPSIAVSSNHHLVLGFSGSHAGEYAGAFYTGHHALDPPGVTATPALLCPGAGPYNHVDGYGNARWGDYSLTSVDPGDDTTLWTIQEYAGSNNRWETRIAELAYPASDPVSYCITAPNSAGAGARMTWSGSSSIAADDFHLVATDCPPGQFLMFYYGAGQTQVPFGDGWRCVNAGGVGVFRFQPFLVDSLGVASLKFDWDNPPAGTGGGLGQWSAGDTWNCQAWFRDPPAGGTGFNLSDGLVVSVSP